MFTPTLSKLDQYTTQELKEQYDSLASNTVVGTKFFLDEINRREMMALTRQMWVFTAIVTAATIINLAIVLFR